MRERENTLARAFGPMAVAILGLALGLVFSLGAAARADAADSPAVGAAAVSRTIIPLSGTFFHPGTAENVIVSGAVRVQFPGDPVKPCRIHLNLTDTGSTGAISGIRYRAFGAVNYTPNPAAPCANNTFTRQVSFRIHPGDPVFPGDPVKPRVADLQVNVTTTFDAEGNLTEGSSATVVVEEVDNPPSP